MKLLDRYFIGLNNKGNLIFTDVVTDEVSSLFVEAYKCIPYQINVFDELTDRETDNLKNIIVFDFNSFALSMNCRWDDRIYGFKAVKSELGEEIKNLKIVFHKEALHDLYSTYHKPDTVYTKEELDQLIYGFRFGCGDYCFIRETDYYSDSTERLLYFYVTAIEEYKAGRTKDIAERFLELYGTGFRNRLITPDEINDILTKVY